MTCGHINGKTGAICQLEWPHPGKKHRLDNCDARKVQEWEDEASAVSPWNRELEPVLLKKVS